MNETPRLTAIAAVARNGVIGDGQRLPWHLPEDFRRFKRATMGGALVMGRRTYESMGQALPGRTSLVLTRAEGWHPTGASLLAGAPRPTASARAQPMSEGADTTWGVAVPTVGACEPAPEARPTEVIVVHSVAEALTELARRPDQRWWCAGGGEIYRALWPYTTHLDLTEVKSEPEGATRFPTVGPAEWREMWREVHEQFDFVTYERRSRQATDSLHHALTSRDAL